MKDRLVFLRKAALIVLASLFSSIGLNMFIIPHMLLSGGVSGIALIVQYLSSVPAAYVIFLLNVPLFILSYRELDREFTILTIIGTVAQSFFLIVTKNVSHYFVLQDLLLSCIYGGVMHGLAIGIIFSNHGSLGGTDIISMIIRRKKNFDIGKISFFINIVIVSVGSIFFGVEKGLYTLVSMYTVSVVTDKVINGFGKTKLLFIITDKADEINIKIQHELKRSSTLLYGLGSYTKVPKKIIYCAVSLSQVPKVKAMVEQADPFAFVTILDASEVQGKGFRKPI